MTRLRFAKGGACRPDFLISHPLEAVHNTTQIPLKRKFLPAFRRKPSPHHPILGDIFPFRGIAASPDSEVAAQ